ncbi:membrane protein hemolysin III homolog [Mesobacillus boroniphilus JCM 21738]|uniref:Membrane protein hemolysin III homolog n=1 Tax=Mesobacillus boroniphilus JCM 21738 TaxID=1294265 RepID=W4RWG5_9BACI|nr:membrane protein hemolysin III homolog [Mesobacillus boroniphilus JCM 21738]
MANVHVFTKREEIANAIIHGIGGLLSIAALVILIVFASLYGTAWHVVSFTLFGVTMVLLYTSSTSSTVSHPAEQRTFLKSWTTHPSISSLPAPIHHSYLSP